VVLVFNALRLKSSYPPEVSLGLKADCLVKSGVLLLDSEGNWLRKSPVLGGEREAGLVMDGLFKLGKVGCLEIARVDTRLFDVGNVGDAAIPPVLVG